MKIKTIFNRNQNLIKFEWYRYTGWLPPVEYTVLQNTFFRDTYSYYFSVLE